MDKRYQVFLSSTFRDLEEERMEVMEALLELDCIPCGMEYFPAANDDQWSFIQSLINQCDYYIVVVGGRYGSVAADGLSYTEKEYHHAVARGIPVIGFVHANPDMIPKFKSENDADKAQKLAAFRALVQSRLCKQWSSPAELSGVISRSLVSLIKQNPRNGWVRADSLTGSDDLTPALEKAQQQIVQLTVEKKRAKAESEALHAQLQQSQVKMQHSDEENRTLLGKVQHLDGKLGQCDGEKQRLADRVKRQQADLALAQEAMVPVVQGKTRHYAQIGLGVVGGALLAVMMGRFFSKQDVVMIPSMSASASGVASISAPEPTPTSSPTPEIVKPRAIGSSFQDDLAGAGKGPMMVVLPSGNFNMGEESSVGLSVTVAKPFALGKYEVTVKEYLACVTAKKCPEPEWREKDGIYHFQTGIDKHYSSMDEALTGDNYPIVGVSWDNAKAYVKWLNEVKTDSVGEYKLPSEAEWEYGARATTTTTHPWGDQASHEYANYGKDICCEGLASGRDKWVYTSPVGSFGANKFMLNDMHGNVWEWVEDCYQANYPVEIKDGSAWNACPKEIRRVLRGGSWGNTPSFLRSAIRIDLAPGNRNYIAGFRVARTLP